MCLFSCASSQKAKAFSEIFAGIPAKNFSSYRFDPSTDLADRVLEAPEFVLAYLRETDKVTNYTAYMPSSAELAEVRKNLALLPPKFKAILQQRLIGIYFVNNWIGIGMADYVLDSDRPGGAYFTKTYTFSCLYSELILLK